MRVRQRLSVRMVAFAGAGVLVASLAACGSGRTDEGGGGGGSSTSGGAVTVGTTDKVVSADPAGSYDNGSLLVENQIYQFLMIIPPGGKTPQPDAAKSCDFTNPTTYTCAMKPGLKFTNGHDLTATDAAFSFQRIVDINDPNGPASLLANMKSVKAEGDNVVFTLANGNDQTFPFILGTSAGPLVDEELFPKDKLLPDEQAIGSGPYSFSSYNKNQLVQFKANPNYNGVLGKPANSSVALKYYAESENLKLDIQNKKIDVAWRSLTTQDIDSLRNASGVKVLDGPGGEIRYLVFNLKTQPGDSEQQKRAIRRAVAYSIDRQAIADKVYKGTYSPLYSMVADGLPGHQDVFKSSFGATPDKSKAAAELSGAGVKTPVTLNIQWNPDHYGSSSDQEYNEVKRQLEETGLFTVKLQSTEWVTYSKERRADAYPVYQLGWFPDFPDADNYLSPFLVENNFVGAHYCDPKAKNRPCDSDGVLPLLTTEQTSEDESARTAAIEQIQQKTTDGTLPTLPLLQGKQIAVVADGTTGVEKTLDSTFIFRFTVISKS
jgi:peptide/nickel transport system substrate-binding protein